MKANAADGKGIPLDESGFMPFPSVAGGSDEANVTMGGINGWLVTKGASPKAVDFLSFFMTSENQQRSRAEILLYPCG